MPRFQILLLLFFTFGACAQPELTSDKSLVVFSYNVENLFDTIDAPEKNDEDFLPEGKYQWTSKRYAKKLEQLAKVIEAPNPKNLPAVIGLYEVENRKVVEDLAATKKLIKANYEVVHYESPDQRGIDVAMLYRKDMLKLLFSRAFSIKLPVEPPYPTRDVLYVKLLYGKNDTLHFFLNHWPSRRLGAEESEPNRMTAARVVRTAVDSIFSVSSPDAKIIIMGDFNDYPSNKSLCETLAADTLFQKPGTGRLFNLSYILEKQKSGTYHFKGEWNVLDQFVVSYGLLNSSGIHAHPNAAKIMNPNWLLYFKKGSTEGRPKSTYYFNKYYGNGYSDHLPIYMELFND